MSSVYYPLIAGVCVLISVASAQVCSAVDPGDTQELLAALKSNYLDERQFKLLTQFIHPRDSEEKWRETPWIPNIHEGRKISVAKNKPIFLWAMNGDPLGCV